jgi:hypothetical protein
MTNLPDTLIKTIHEIYKPAGMKITQAGSLEAESAEYGACRFGLNGKNIAFRIAKTTPTKIGQFVTIWKRPTPDAEIAPLDINDNVDFVVVNVSDGALHGQFIFDQKILLAKGVISRNGKGGKRAIRVYPAWSKPVAKDAIKTQQWQLQYFFALTSDKNADLQKVQKLFYFSAAKRSKASPVTRCTVHSDIGMAPSDR